MKTQNQPCIKSKQAKRVKERKRKAQVEDTILNMPLEAWSGSTPRDQAVCR